MTNQLYQLIPEPAGDWQEGDKSTVHTEGYRLRPVKAQSGQLEWTVKQWPDVGGSPTSSWDIFQGETIICADLTRYDATLIVKAHNATLRPVPAQSGQLWRDLADDEPAQGGDRYIRQIELRQRPVPAQACACEGLRKIAEEAESQLRADGYIYLPDKLRKALAQSCQPSVSHSVQQPDLSGSCGSGTPEATRESAVHADCLAATTGNNPAEVRSLPAQPPAAASECGDPRNPNKECLYDEYRIGPKLCIYCRKPKTAASEAQATPRTDAASVEISRPGDGDKLDWISFARQLERELNQANATVAALRQENERLHLLRTNQIQTELRLRRELAEAKKAKHRAGQLWPKLIQAEDDRDQWKDLAKTAQDESLRIRKECDQWKERAKSWAELYGNILGKLDKLHPEVWHDYATDPPKEEDGVDVLCHGNWEVFCLYPNGDIRIKSTKHVPLEPGCKWARITWPPVPHPEPVQDKDEEAAQYAADHVFQPLMGEVTISDSQHRVIRNYAITVAKAALSHARATEEK